jgi:hypothetical protein
MTQTGRIQAERSPATQAGTWSRSTGLLLAACFAVVFGACSSSTDPGGGSGGDDVVYTPSGTTLSLDFNEQVTFRVEGPSGATAVVEFRRGDELLSEGREFLYTAAAAGADSVTAVVTVGGSTYRHTWRISVAAEPELLPPEVVDLQAAHGEQPGEVVLTWSRPAAGDLPHPLESYRVAVSYDGPIGEPEWSSAEPLPPVAIIDTGFLYRVVFDSEHDGLQAGEHAWFAARARDVDGRLSPLAERDNVDLRISAPYEIEGYVVDDSGAPVRNATVSYRSDCIECRTTTTVAGYFRVGPFRDFDKVLFTTLTRDDEPSQPDLPSYYDLIAHPDRTDSVGVTTAQPVNLMLIKRHGITSDCGSYYDGAFMTYLTSMTFTNGTLDGNIHMYRWSDYPVPVWIPPAINRQGTLDLQATALAAVDIWNDLMGEDYLSLAADSLSAGIEFRFEKYGGSLDGKTEIIVPSGHPQLNTVVPQRTRIWIADDLQGVYALEVTLHEIGHALGLGNHSLCPNGVHLMNASPSGMISAGGDTIHVDERRAIRCVRYLPQAFPMTGYESAAR